MRYADLRLGIGRDGGDLNPGKSLAFALKRSQIPLADRAMLAAEDEQRLPFSERAERVIRHIQLLEVTGTKLLPG